VIIYLNTPISFDTEVDLYTVSAGVRVQILQIELWKSPLIWNMDYRFIVFISREQLSEGYLDHIAKK
jgi:hypothetical protein